jgi:hypothetical protein
VSQSGIRSNDVTPGVTVLASVVLKNLGELVAPVLQTSSTQSTTP